MQLTHHAKLRSAQRNISHEDIAKVIKYGSPLHRTGIVFYTIRKKDLEKMKMDRRKTEKLEGLTILVSPDGVIRTVYKCRSAHSAIKKKRKTKPRR